MIDDKALADLREKHGAVRAIDLSDGRTFVFRKARAADFRSHKAAMMQIITNPPAAALANELAARSLCVYPSAEEFDQLRDSDPQVADEIGSMLISEVGTGLAVIQGKQ